MFKNILVPIHLEYKKNHEKLFEGALKVLEKENGKISLFNVDENSAHPGIYPTIDENNQHEYKHGALEKLKEISDKYLVPMDKVSFIIKYGAVHQEILKQAEKMKADAIVMMATKPGMGSYFISSTAERVIRHAECSVFVIRLDED
ncbi:universal stress protein [Sulfurospirillum arcachonense]|uniref:universal stress protein n=1 Tax=Sulfurospirillum arcachonense TaxID=57666 RepID=UPI00046965FA|nr:universal stress protein [Sulfurospirillum arcachonense]